MLDISGSVQDEYEQSIQLARAIVQGLDVNSGAVRIGALAFSNYVVGEFFMNQYVGNQQNVINAVNFYPLFGETNTPDGLTECLNVQLTAANGDRAGVQNYVIIVTDGYSDVNQQNTIPNAMLIRNTGTIIYSIAVGPNPQVSELDGLASSPSSQYVIPLLTRGDVTQTAALLLDDLCQSNGRLTMD